MRTYKGGDTVTAGFYWNRGAWGAEVIPAGGACRGPATSCELWQSMQTGTSVLPWVNARILRGTEQL
jgi:hypothetical protein